MSGAKRNRPELARLLDQIRDDDVAVVTRLDRLARSTKNLLDIAEKLNDAGAELRSLAEPWVDMTSPAGRMVLTALAGIAEFEQALIHQRTSSGRVAAKARGVRFGRPPKLTADQVALGERLVGEGTSVRDAAKLLKCHHATLYRALLGPWGIGCFPSSMWPTRLACSPQQNSDQPLRAFPPIGTGPDVQHTYHRPEKVERHRVRPQVAIFDGTPRQALHGALDDHTRACVCRLVQGGGDDMLLDHVIDERHHPGA